MKEQDLVERLFAAARNAEWEKIDHQILPHFSELDGDTVARRLLEMVSDPDSNIRDVVATGLAAVNVSDRKLLEGVMDRMSVMAREDSEVFPSGRAAVVLLKHRDMGFDKQIGETLSDFKSRVDDLNWKNDLLENIPGIEEVLNS